MENRFPLFSGGRILKKESLWDVRDYTYGGWQIYYRDYTDGILSGCELRAQEEELVIGRGMIKYRDFIYLLQEEARVPYQANDEWVSLKARFTERDSHLDYREYHLEFFLDKELILEENQLEMCRFYLRKGSWLRDAYKGFYDMATEFDTVNLLHARVAGRGQALLHPKVLLQFARELWEKDEKEMADYAFCFEIWNSAGRVEKQAVAAYLAEKRRNETVKEIYEMDNGEIYRYLAEVLQNVGRGRKREMTRKVIFVE